MIEEIKSAPAEGEALPASIPPPLKGGFFSTVEGDVKRVIAAIDAWYEKHFHSCAVAGTAPLSADDKAALIQHVAEAVAPTATEDK